MNEAVVGINPQHLYPMRHAGGQVFVQVLERSYSHGDERQRLEQFEKADED